MKKNYIRMFIIVLLSIFLINTSFAEIEDNQIIDALDKQENSEISESFKLQTFKSCENLESIMQKYIKTYWELNKNRYIRPVYRGWIMIDDEMTIDTAMPMEKSLSSDMDTNSVMESKSTSVWWASSNFSKTNTQVDWVDESEIVKTDGKYIYYYNSKNKAVYISDTKNKLKIIKKIKIPKSFNSPVLYLGKNRLIIMANGYSRYNKTKSRYWRSYQDKTYVIVFDTTNIEKPTMLKLYAVDGRLAKSRKIGKYLYVISANSFNIPFYSFKTVDDIIVPRTGVIPNKIEVNLTKDSSKQNLVLKWKKFPFNISKTKVAECNQIEYSLPTEDTLKKYDFSPSYNIISVIDTQISDAQVKTKVVVWNTTEIYMSLKNLYITDRIYQNNRVRCPTFARCIMPYFERWENSLIHKLNIKANDIKYQTSTIIPWNPLTQYSMDEKGENFRIITQKFYPKRETGVYIMDKDLKLFWKLDWLWEKENFKSSRFMWDKLFLVTFKQIDPFYVIDLKDESKPKVIWELKIPGYSEYLHPYDKNHIIWLGYDTYINEWGGTRKGWLKLDLYEINYDKKVSGISTDCSKYEAWNCPSYCEEKLWPDPCLNNVWPCAIEPVVICGSKKNLDKKDFIEVKQLHSLIMWDAGSKTDAIRNPRMFIFNKAEKTLLLPVTIQKNESKDSYKIIDFFQGLYSIKIDKDSGIKKLWRISHIDYSWLEEKRNIECEKYFKKKTEKEKCRILLNWEEYCPPKEKYNSYVPEYCFKDSPIWSYIARKRWDYNDSFISRALYIDNNIYSISNKKLQENNMENFEKISETLMK